MDERSRRRARPGPDVLTPPSGVPAIPAVVVDPCVCGHARAAHEHYRRGSDCGACGSAVCSRFRRRAGVLRRLLGR